MSVINDLLFPDAGQNRQSWSMASIDLSNSLSVGLVGAVIPANGAYDLIANQTLSATGTALKVPSGVQTNGSSSYISRAPATGIAWVDNQTILAVTTPTSVGAGSMSPIVSFGAGTSRGGGGIGLNSSGYPAIGIMTSNGLEFATGVASVVGKRSVIVGTKNSVTANLVVWCNGLTVGVGSTNGSSTYGGSATWEFGIGRGPGFDANGNTYYAAAVTELALVWNRVLSNAEIAQISANPWQLFAANLPIFMAASSGGSASIAVTGVQSTGSVGIVIPSYNKSSSLSGVQATSATGTLALKVLGATVGVQATSAAGVITSSGDAAIALVGVQSTLSVGAVVATVSSSVGVAGVQTASSAGVVSSSSSSPGNINVFGVMGSSSVGNVYSASAITLTSVSASSAVANVYPSGVKYVGGASAVGQTGAVSSSAGTSTNSSILGVQAGVVAGSIAGQVYAGTIGISGAGYIGSISASISDSTYLLGALATGYVGSISTSISDSAYLLGALATGYAGLLSESYGAPIVAPAGRTLVITQNNRFLTISPVNRVLAVQA